MSKTERKEATHAYVGRCLSCNGWRSLSVDNGRKSDLTYCAGADRIDRVPIEEARQTPSCKCERSE